MGLDRLLGEPEACAGDPACGNPFSADYDNLHSAGFGGDGTFRMYDVWETGDQANRFYGERLRPLVEELIASGNAAAPPLRQELYELHNVSVNR